MTTREFFENVTKTDVISDEMKDFAAAWLEKNAAAQVKRAETAAEKRAEKFEANAPIREALLAVITDEPKTATTLIEEAGLDIKPQSVPSLLKSLYESGVITKETIKVTGKGNRVGYVRA